MLKGLGAYWSQMGVWLGAVAAILVGSTFLNSSVISYRLRELDLALEAATRAHKQNRNLAMLIQYELLRRRVDAQEDETDYATEARLHALALDEEGDTGVAFERLLDPVAFLAIRTVRFLMGKKTEPDRPEWAPGPRLRTAYYYERRRLYREAIRWYQSSLDAEPRRRGQILLHMGFCYSLVNEYEKAYRLFQHVCDSFPGEDEAAIAAKLYRKLKLLHTSIQNAASLARRTRDRLEAGRNLYQSMRYYEALEILSDVGKRSGDFPPNRVQEAWYLGGRCYEEIGRDSLAVQCFHNLTGSYPKSIWAAKANQRLLLISALYVRDETGVEKAKEALEKQLVDEQLAQEVISIGREVAAPPLELPAPPALSVSPTIPVVEARPVQEQAIEDSIVESSSRVFSTPIEVRESARERREQEQLFDEQLKRRAAALKQAEEENGRKLEAQKRLREQFKALVELERQKRAEELETERAIRERDERLDARVGDSLSALQVPAVSGKGREELPGEELLTLRGQFMTLEQRLDLAEQALRTSDEAAFVRAQKRESEGRMRSRETASGVHAGDTATQTGGPFGAAMYRVTVARAVCRSEPSAGADSVYVAGRADRVYADRIENDWIRITVRGDTHAWVRRDQCVPESELDHRQIERLESLAGREHNRWIVTADSVSLCDARLGGKELRTLFAGDLLLLNSSQAGMLRVTTERRKVTGFIPSVSAAQYSSLSASQVAKLKATGQKLRESAQMAMALKYRGRETIQDSIGRHIPNINVLYKKKLKMYPNMEGTVWVTFRVDPSGKVISAKVKSSDITQKDFIDPFLAYAQRIHFKSVPQEVGDMSFVFPFEFSLK